MEKIDTNLYRIDNISPRTIVYKINELIDVVNKLQDLAENSLKENEEWHQIKNFWFRKWVKHALDYMESLLRWDQKSELYEPINYEYILHIRKQKMQSIYQDNEK